MIGTTTRIGLALLLLLALGAPAARAADKELAHDDGRQEGRQSAAGTGHAIRYDAPKGAWWIKSVRIRGERYGGGYDPAETTFTVALCDERLSPLLSFQAPYSLFPAGSFDWVEVPFPRVTIVPEHFQVVVAFDPSATRGVFVAWAKTTETHSGHALPGGSEQPFQADAEWMIRPVLTKKPPRGAVKEMVLALDDGVQAGKKSLGGSGHVIEMKKPSGTWWIVSVLVHGSRYGGGYDPASTTFGVAVTNPGMKALVEQRAAYALFGGEPSWVEVTLPEPLKAPSTFRVAVDFDPGPTKGVYVGFAAEERTHSFTGRVGAGAQAFGEGEWMIRVRLVSEKPEAAAPPAPAASSAETYRKDFAFVARTVRDRFPALERKGVDWKAVCAAWEPRFASCPDDRTLVLDVQRLLAVLDDAHTGVTSSKVEAHVPAFDGLYGAGMWIATQGGQLVLRALVPGHELEGRLQRGALLVSIGGRPARFVHEEVRQRVHEWIGWSSTHFLDARLSFQLFPFGEARTLKAVFVNPDGAVVAVDLPRWGPGGRGLSRAALTMPAGLEPRGAAVAKRLSDDVGYVRILGGMDEETRAAFFAAFDELQGVKGILLDCRGMGGGGDDAAWAMAGRFFPKRTPLKHDPALQPTGHWQLDGPVVMLQDEREISSAETFTWAMVETGRVVSVGRPTGGATIVPRTYEAPSGLFAFRLGSRDRETSIEGVHPDGVGTPPHVRVPYEPALLAASADPILDVGLEVLGHLVGGVERDVVVDLYDGVLDPAAGDDGGRLERAVAAWERAGRQDARALPPALVEALPARVAGLEAWLESPANVTPDARGLGRRLAGLARAAEALGLRAVAEAARAVAVPEPEIAAQEAWEALVARGLPPNKDALEAYEKAHAGTRWAAAVSRAFD